jgi:chromate transporter
MMHEEVVVKKNGLKNNIFRFNRCHKFNSGPNSTEMAIHIGHERMEGLIVAGLCFIVPAVMLTGIFAWLYKDYGQLPEIQPFIRYKTCYHRHYSGRYFSFGKKILENSSIRIIGLFCFYCCCLQFNEIALFLALDSWLYLELIDQQRLK